MFDDYFPFRKYNCKLEHAKHWLNLFVNIHNDMVFGRMIKGQSPKRVVKDIC
jgi:hypothetical protein